jgi:hypothetical protein
MSRRPRGQWIVRLIFLVTGLVGAGMVAGGAVSIVHKESGQPARATVASCQQIGVRYTSFQCEGSWVEGGALVGGGGHVVYGVIDDATPSDIGRTLAVRVSGEHAYTLSLRVPIILVAVGLAIALGSILLVVATGRQRPVEIPTILSAGPGAVRTSATED